MSENTYRPLLRPAGYSTLPDGLEWDYVEMPPDLAANRPDVPRSSYRYGIIRTARPLTTDEMRRFDLQSHS